MRYCENAESGLRWAVGIYGSSVEAYIFGQALLKLTDGLRGMILVGLRGRSLPHAARMEWSVRSGEDD
jgi:hypothetical protein